MIKKLTLWLRKDGRKNAPEHFIKDIQDHGDPYHEDRFYGRTVCEDDKFETGVFMTLDDIQKMWEASSESICVDAVCGCCSDILPKYQTANDYLASVGVDLIKGDK